MLLLATSAETRETLFELAGWPGGWAGLLTLLIAAGLCYGAVWLYRCERRAGASRAVRLFLTGIRCLVLILLLGIWLQPAIATYVTRSVAGNVIVLVDHSASMSVADATPAASAPAARSDESDVRRTARVESLLTENDAQWLRRLAQRNELALYLFGDDAARREPQWTTAAQTQPALSAVPLSGRTDIGQAVAQALDEVGGAPVAGIVLISDGASNRGMSAEDIAAYARRLKAPIYSIGVGQPVEPPNVRVVSISAPPTAPRGDPFEIRVQVAATDIPPTDVDLEVIAEPAAAATDTAPAAELVVARRRIQLSNEEAPPLLFQITPTVAGEFTYRARIAPLPGESIATDNIRETTVLILEDSLRVLLVSGRPSYDYRFLTALLERDKSIDLSCWLQSADQRAVRDGDTVITSLPRTPEEIFPYDAILLLDPNPTDLDAAWAQTIKRFVDEFGGGVLFEAGTQYSARFLNDPRMADLVAILPVTPDPEAEIRISEQGTFRARPFPLQTPDDALAHPLLALGPDPSATRAVWEALPGVFWYLPVLRAKPIATVLLQHSNASLRTRYGPPVLFAVQPVGSGRSAFLAFESTWRWRGPAERYYNQFWVRLIRYLGQARRESASKRGTIVLDRESIGVGDVVRIDARVLDSRFVPWAEPTINASIEFADGLTRPITLEAIAGREGWFTARVLFDRDGPTLIRVPLPGADPASQPATGPAEPTALTKRVRVQRPDIEMRTLRLHDENLRVLSDETGGAYVPLSDAAKIPDLIESASRKDPPRPSGPPTNLWDRAWVLMLIAGLLSIEWAVRRRNHLL